MFQVPNLFPLFVDLGGNLLTNGYIYIGAENQNPETNPITVYWDEAGLIPADQPLRTINGQITRNGISANIYVGAAYSITVRDVNSRLVSSKLSVTDTLTSGDSSLDWGEIGISTTYASASSFTVADAANFHVGRRIKLVGGADRYGYVSDVTSLTITVDNITDSSGVTQTLHASMTTAYIGAATNPTTAINSPIYVASKAIAVKLTPRAGMTLLVGGTDGGLFYAVTGAAPGTYADNGGSYCGTQYIPTGGDGSSAWIRDGWAGYAQPEINIASFGAISDYDGSTGTDNKSSIEAAIAALPLVYDGTGSDPLTRNGLIRVDIGRFLVTSLSIPAGVSFCGQVGDSTYGGSSGEVGSIIVVDNTAGNGITITGGQIKSSTQSFKNLSFIGGANNLSVTATSAVAGLLNCIYISEGFGITFEGCSIHNYNGGAGIKASSGTQMCKFINNTITWIGDGGVDGGGPRGGANTYGDGINVGAGGDCLFLGNFVEQCGGIGLFGGSNMRIEANFVDFCSWGIRTDFENAMIIGNSCKKHKNSGIYVNVGAASLGNNSAIVIGNTSVGNNYYNTDPNTNGNGLLVVGAAIGLVIIGNDFSDIFYDQGAGGKGGSGSPVCQNGIRIGSASASGVLIGNIFADQEGSTTSGYWLYLGDRTKFEVYGNRTQSGSLVEDYIYVPASGTSTGGIIYGANNTNLKSEGATGDTGIHIGDTGILQQSVSGTAIRHANRLDTIGTIDSYKYNGVEIGKMGMSNDGAHAVLTASIILPTSATGLPSGSLWNNAGTITVV